MRLVRAARLRLARRLAPELEQELRRTRRQLKTSRKKLKRARAELEVARRNPPLFDGARPARVTETIEGVRTERLTYLGAGMLDDLAASVLQLERDGLEGTIVEAGTARGG